MLEIWPKADDSGGNYQYNGPRFLVDLCMAGSTQIGLNPKP